MNLHDELADIERKRDRLKREIVDLQMALGEARSVDDRGRPMNMREWRRWREQKKKALKSKHDAIHELNVRRHAINDELHSSPDGHEVFLADIREGVHGLTKYIDGLRRVATKVEAMKAALREARDERDKAQESASNAWQEVRRLREQLRAFGGAEVRR